MVLVIALIVMLVLYWLISKRILYNTTKKENKYPDLYLPVSENYKISDKFCGYMDSVSVDNNPMILVELTGLSYRYRPTMYAVDRVNGTMYGKLSGGFRITNERPTVEPQYRGGSLAGMYGPVWPMHRSTLLGPTQTVTPLADSTPMTQPSQMPMIPDRIPPVGDILEPTSNEQARAGYLEKQMRQMSSISGLPSSIPPLRIYQHKDEINGAKKQYLKRGIVEIETNNKQA